MYTQGETFYFEINDEDFELHVLENVTMGENEYLITEDFDGKVRVFKYDEQEEDLEFIEDKREAQEIIEFWKDEYLISSDISDFDDDEYYDREDRDVDHNFYDYDDNYDDNDY